MDTENQIQFALSCLRSGRPIICPSESCYSISCDVRSKKVCAIIDAGDLNDSVSVSAVYDTRTGKMAREGVD